MQGLHLGCTILIIPPEKMLQKLKLHACYCMPKCAKHAFFCKLTTIYDDTKTITVVNFGVDVLVLLHWDF